MNYSQIKALGGLFRKSIAAISYPCSDLFEIKLYLRLYISSMNWGFLFYLIPTKKTDYL